jgi:hypothetical protein
MSDALAYWEVFVKELPAEDAMIPVLNGDLRRLVAKLGELEAAIEQHRLDVGQAYGIGSFKTQHAANMRLWAS